MLCSPYSVPDELIEGAPVFVLGQNPGAEEEKAGKPFVGRTGQMMIGEFFPEAGLVRGENVSLGNALCYRFTDPATGKRVNKIPTGKVLRDALASCAGHINIPSSTRLIVATGAAAWKATGQPAPITDWRGFIGPNLFRGCPVLGVLHVADLFGQRNSKLRAPSHRDWRKIPLFLSGRWPAPMPEIVGVSHQHDWWQEALHAPFIAVDTEYDPDTKELHTIGLGFPGSDVLQLNWLRVGEASKRQFISYFSLFDGTFVLQNAIADIEVLRAAGVLAGDYRSIFAALKVHDTMLAHSVLWAEWPHTLEFLASVYSDRPKMKHLKHVDPAMYNAGDVVDTISAWQGMEMEFAVDPKSATIYRQEMIPLLPIVMRAHERGIRVNKSRVASAQAEYTEKMALASQLAKSYTGRREFNVGSDDQLKEVLYDSEGLPIQRHKDTKKVSLDGDSVATLRALYEPFPDFEREEREGLSWGEVEDRVSSGAHPLLEARVFYAGAMQAFSHYIKPLIGVERIHPEFHVHAQANARWSTISPPMAQIPADLRDIVCPDEGTGWLEWDWDQFELRINAATCNDIPSLEAFANGWDIHTLNSCDLFGLPYPPDRKDPHKSDANQAWRQSVKWEGKDDPRRVFAKRFVYRLDYGGDPARAGDIPGAKALGLSSTLLVQASTRYLAAHPAKAAWRRATRLSISKPPGGGMPYAETFLGRKRRISESGPSAWRIAFDYPMQAGVSDVANFTAIRIEREMPWLDLMYQMHDGWKYQCPMERLSSSASQLREIVEAEWVVYGTKVRFPATFKTRLS